MPQAPRGGPTATAERAVNRLTIFRAVATRCGKRLRIHLGTVALAALMIWRPRMDHGPGNSAQERECAAVIRLKNRCPWHVAPPSMSANQQSAGG